MIFKNMYYNLDSKIINFFESLNPNMFSYICDAYEIFRKLTQNGTNIGYKSTAQASLIFAFYNDDKVDNYLKKFIKETFGEYRDVFSIFPKECIGTPCKKYPLDEMLYFINDVQCEKIDYNTQTMHEIFTLYNEYIYAFENYKKTSKDMTPLDIFKLIFFKYDTSSYIYASDYYYKCIITFDNFNESFEKFKEDYSERCKEHINNFENHRYLEDCYKIYKYLSTYRFINYYKQELKLKNLSLFLGLYFHNSTIAQNFEKIGVNLQKALQFLNIADLDIVKRDVRDTEYIDICDFYKFFNGFYVSKNFTLKVDEIAYKLIDFNSDILDVIYGDVPVRNKKLVVSKIKRYEKISEFYFTDVPSLDITNLRNIVEYGNELSQMSKILSQDFKEIIETKFDSSSMNVIRYSIFPEETRKSFLNRLQYEVTINSETVYKLERFFCDQYNIIEEQINKFDDLKQLICVYIYKIEKYIENLVEGNKELIKNVENETKFRVIDDKIESFKITIDLMYSEYKKITILESMHLSIFNKLITINSCVLPSLHTESYISPSYKLEEGENKKLRNSTESIRLTKELFNDLDKLNGNGIFEVLNSLDTTGYDKITKTEIEEKLALLRQEGEKTLNKKI